MLETAASSPIADAPLILSPDLTAVGSEDGACAPFLRRPAEIEPIWRRFAERARTLGHPDPERAVTAEPGLCLIADGRRLRPLSSGGGRVVFVVPPGTGSLRLISRHFVPADMRPWQDDWRRLGVAVGAIVLGTGTEAREIAPDHPELAQGWHVAERDGAALWRWTDGDAELPFAIPEDGVIAIYLHATGDYPMADAKERLAA